MIKLHTLGNGVVSIPYYIIDDVISLCSDEFNSVVVLKIDALRRHPLYIKETYFAIMSKIKRDYFKSKLKIETDLVKKILYSHELMRAVFGKKFDNTYVDVKTFGEIK